MSIRSNLEDRLRTFCAAQTPPIPIAFEGIPFVKPSNSRYVQCWLLPSTTTSPTVEGYRRRVRGLFQISVYCPDGRGSKEVEDLSEQIAALYPVVPKNIFTELSIDRPTQTSQAYIDANYRCIPVTVSYRAEFTE